MRHFLEITDITSAELTALLAAAAQRKATPRADATQPLKHQVIALVFEKPSLRTRASFETGAIRLGGASLFFPGGEIGIGQRESAEDFARTMSAYADAIVMRVFSHKTLTAVAAAASVPVINALSDQAHPCQALADLLTIQETFGSLAGKRVAFIGDGNNVARSLALGCRMAGVEFILAGPKKYHLEAGLGTATEDAFAAVKKADILYTDVWTSMGQESETAARRREFAAYQVNESLLKHAPAHARVMHCLPAHRGEEITADVIDGPRSIAFAQAGNRLHAQMALMEMLLP